MPTREQFLADIQGCKFKNNMQSWPIDFESILALLDREDVLERMKNASIANRPALGAVVHEIERRPDVDRYFRSTDASETRRFQQAVAVAVRMAMESLGWETTGRKGTIGRRVPVPSIGTPSEQPFWFAKGEIYEQSTQIRDAVATSDSPIQAGLISAGKTPEERAALFDRLYDRLMNIGTPEERAETCASLMKALAETRKAEGRVF